MTVYFELTPADGKPGRTVLQPGLQRINVAVGDRYRIIDEATGKTPPDIVVKRLDNHMIIDGLPDGATVELSDFYAHCGVSSPCTLVVDGAGASSAGPVEISPASPPLQALTDGSFVLYPSGYSGAPAMAAAESGEFPQAAVYAAGGLAVAALAAAAGGGGGGGGGDAAPPTAVSPSPPPPAPAPSPAAPDPVPPVVAPGTVASVAAITDDAEPRAGNVARGAATNDNTPAVSGSLSAPLAAGESLEVMRDGTLVTAPVIVEGANWRFTDSSLADGAHTYSARVVDAGVAGPVSAGYGIVVDTVNSSTASITSVTDNVRPGVGNVRDGGTTNDPTPTFAGLLSSELAAGEELHILRDNVVIGTSAQVTGTGWTFTDGLSADDNYDYAVRVVDAAGNLGPESAVFDLRVRLDDDDDDDDDDDNPLLPFEAMAGEPLAAEDLLASTSASSDTAAAGGGSASSPATWSSSSIDSLVNPDLVS